MTGILAVGTNHFIVQGPEPTAAQALELARHWTIIPIGRPAAERVGAWSLLTKAFREELRWAWVMDGAGPNSAAVTQLLSEMKERGIEIRRVALI